MYLKIFPCVSGDISNLANRNSTKVSEIFSLGTILTSGTFEENRIVGSYDNRLSSNFAPWNKWNEKTNTTC